MRLLIDTHALIWFAEGDEKLSATARCALESPDNSLWISSASIWEMAIKISIGKLVVPGGLSDFRKRVEQGGVQLLDITGAHAERVAELPFHHRDPFDRLLVAQAELEQMSLVSQDETLDAYGGVRVW
jgi:PIN domain nuclease of toxin-antitoxin system